ncbi:MAG TPA: hypothetical protein VFK90_14235, partial [Anaeromyxobacter sp.]|nr:hypothetical protein [Anaeromyxobacter sp.]
MRRTLSLLLAVAAPALASAGGAPPAVPRSPAAAPRDARPFCAGEYADDLAAQSAAAREFDRVRQP